MNFFPLPVFGLHLGLFIVDSLVEWLLWIILLKNLIRGREWFFQPHANYMYIWAYNSASRLYSSMITLLVSSRWESVWFQWLSMGLHRSANWEGKCIGLHCMFLYDIVHPYACSWLASSPGPLFFIGGRGKEGLVYTVHASESPRNPGASDFSVKYYVSCPSNERKLSVILLIISAVRLLWTLAGIFLHGNSLRQLFLSRRGSRASLKSKFGGTRRRV